MSKSLSQPRLSSQQVVRNLFSLSDEEDVLDDFSCGLRKKIFIHGRLFCTDNFLCFYANILGFKTKQVIPFRDIVAIKRVKGTITSSIEIACANKKSYFFGSFLRRNEAFQFIYSLWRNSGYCDESQDKGYWSDGEDPPPLEEEQNEGLMDIPQEEYSEGFETLKVVVPCTPQKFFELFFADNAAFSYGDYFKERGDSEIEITPWGDNEEIGACSRELKFRTKINGPSVGPKTTRIQSAQIYKYQEGTLIIKISTKALDVPFSSYFVIEQDWVITPASADKSRLRCTLSLNFLKSTMFRGTIESRTKADSCKDVEAWWKRAKEKCFSDMQSPAEKPTVERQIHQIAKYEEVDLKEYRKKSKLVKASPNSVNSLLVLNAICLVLLFFYLRHLNMRINSLEEINNESL